MLLETNSLESGPDCRGNNKHITWTLYVCRAACWVPWRHQTHVLISALKWSEVAQLCPTAWTVACQAPLFMEFSRQGYWSGLPFPSGDVPDPGIKPGSPTLKALHVAKGSSIVRVAFLFSFKLEYSFPTNTSFIDSILCTHVCVWNEYIVWSPFTYTLVSFYMVKIVMRDFRGGPVVKNPPSNAGDTSSIPGQGSKILHSTEQLSLCATTREPTCCNYWSSHALELLQHSYWACSPQLESIHSNERVHMRLRRSRMQQLRPDKAK